jgi:hypothetical protein
MWDLKDDRNINLLLPYQTGDLNTMAGKGLENHGLISGKRRDFSYTVRFSPALEPTQSFIRLLPTHTYSRSADVKICWGSGGGFELITKITSFYFISAVLTVVTRSVTIGTHN